MSGFGGLSEERPSVFKTRSELGTHIYRPNVAGMKGRVDLAQPVNRTPDLCFGWRGGRDFRGGDPIGVEDSGGVSRRLSPTASQSF
ncbi:hypothetical protein TNCV_1509141 [Trichonephila clavipes]|nr:hypothetical protein TNCV_1509141 [Trichonephila clavipes]